MSFDMHVFTQKLAPDTSKEFFLHETSNGRKSLFLKEEDNDYDSLENKK